jgi:hypothetical protein
MSVISRSGPLRLVLPLIFSSVVAQLNNVTTPSLNITAISASNGASVLECWQLPGFVASAQPGTSGALNLFLGDLSNATYTVIPPRFNGGIHNAPAAQYVTPLCENVSVTVAYAGKSLTLCGRYVAFLTGLAHLTLPNTTISPTTEAWVQGGKYGLIIAVDTGDVSNLGHVTEYPSDANTVALQIPLKGGFIPKHAVLYDGPCQWNELTGL